MTAYGSLSYGLTWAEMTTLMVLHVRLLSARSLQWDRQPIQFR